MSGAGCLLLVVVNDGVVRVVVLLAVAALGAVAALAVRVTARVCARLAALRVGLLVHLLAELVEHLRQRLGRGLDGCGVAALEGLLELVELALDLGLLGRVDLVAQLLERALGLADVGAQSLTDLGI